MKRYWEDYVLLKDQECEKYFDDNYKGTRMLFILGAGFDERMCQGIKHVGSLSKNMDVWLIRFEEAPNSDSLKYSAKVEENIKELYKVVRQEQISEKEIKMWDLSGDLERPISDPSSVKFITENAEKLQEYDVINIDISALPQNIYFVLLDRLLSIYYGKKIVNIMACENYLVDKKTNPVGIDERAHYFIGYGATGNAANGKPIIWLPVLGECDKERLIKCHDFIMQESESEEICPLVPFPSINERRTDEIILKFREQLFDVWNIEKKNIIYASETNPFQVYRRICETVEHYCKVLKPLGGSEQKENESCLFVFTALTSKLMAIGTFLAAFNLKRESFNINIAGLYNRGYNVEDTSVEMEVETGKNVVYCLCLADNGL